MADDRPRMFDADSARRIADAVRQVEGQAPPGVPRGTAPRIMAPIRNAVVTTAILSRVGTVKGSGFVTLYVDDQVGTGNMVVLQTGVKVWCAYRLTSPIAVGKWVVVGIVDGLQQVLGGDC